MKDFRESSVPDYPGTKLIKWNELLNDFKIKKMGIAGWHMFPHTIYKNISGILGDENIINADEIIRKITLKKSPVELDCLREAARIS